MLLSIISTMLQRMGNIKIYISRNKKVTKQHKNSTRNNIHKRWQQRQYTSNTKKYRSKRQVSKIHIIQQKLW